MKNLKFVPFLLACFLLFGCGTTQETISESPEEIQQALREGKLIKPDDWMRVTTLDEKTHEFSFIGIKEGELQGGDAIIPLTQIKQLELFPLLRTNGESPKPLSLVSESSFESRLAAHIANGIWSFSLLMSDGTIYGVKSSALENGELIIERKTKQNIGQDYEKLASEEFIDAAEEKTVGVTDSGILVSNILRVHSSNCSPRGSFGQVRCVPYDTFSRWPESDDLKMEMVRDQTILKHGDWVRVSLAGEVLREFQYRELSGKALVGGDGLVSVAEIRSLEIYPTNIIAATAGEQAAGAAGAVALVGLTILFWGMGIPVPPMGP